MIILSYNYMGLASQPKKLVVTELMKSYDPNVLMLEENLGLGDEVIGSLSRMLQKWGFQALDSHGRFRGLVLEIKSKR